MAKYLFYLLFGVLSFSLFADDGEIKAAKTAAPSHITEQASIRIWKNGTYVEVHRGTNGFVCLVRADVKGTFEPSCFNEAAANSVLPVYSYERNMLEQGKSHRDILAWIKKHANSEMFPAPEAGAIVYMMSKENKWFGHQQNTLYDIKPHIMLYYPKLAANNMGLNGQHGLPRTYGEYAHFTVVHIETDGI